MRWGCWYRAWLAEVRLHEEREGMGGALALPLVPESKIGQDKEMDKGELNVATICKPPVGVGGANLGPYHAGSSPL